MKWYAAMLKGTMKMVAFPSEVEPSDETHGDFYGFFIGPFWTRRGAEYAAKNSKNLRLKGIPDYEREAEREFMYERAS